MIGPMCVIQIKEARALLKHFSGEYLTPEERELLGKMRFRLLQTISKYDKDEILKTQMFDKK